MKSDAESLPSAPDYKKWETATEDMNPARLLNQAQHLWTEYEYRHDLSWSLLFRFTTAIVAVSVLPYTISYRPSEFVLVFRILVVGSPAIAVALSILGIRRIKKEIELLGHLRSLYRPVQDHLTVPYFVHRRSTFSRDVQRYITALSRPVKEHY